MQVGGPGESTRVGQVLPVSYTHLDVYKRQDQVRRIGHQQQFAVHQVRQGTRALIDSVDEALAFQVDLDDLRQMGLADLMEEARLGATVRELAAPMVDAVILIVKFAHPLRGALDQLPDLLVPSLGL